MQSINMPGGIGYSGPISDDVQHHATTKEERDLLVHALKRYLFEVKALDAKAREVLDCASVRPFNDEMLKIGFLVTQYGGFLDEDREL